MKIETATRKYELWLADETTVDKLGLARKHENMKISPFIFLRATYYRWSQIFPEVCKHLATLPVVFSVADLHIENFGTWRDSEGRLVWGVNDFDEAYPLPFVNDLVRLATSANLAASENALELTTQEICHAILEGYQEALADGGTPFVLAEHHLELRAMAFGILRNPKHFWQRLEGQLLKADEVPKKAIREIEKTLPKTTGVITIARRYAGQGSLGKQRFVAIADYQGARIARETKARVASACVWALGTPEAKCKDLNLLIEKAVRCEDPFFRIRNGWITRRLAPDCSRIELSTIPESRNEKLLLNCMGRETANLHMATSSKRALIVQSLSQLNRHWLRTAVEQMTEAVESDWQSWRDLREKKTSN
jgi:hypothetical protein